MFSSALNAEYQKEFTNLIIINPLCTNHDNLMISTALRGVLTQQRYEWILFQKKYQK
jgi:hypothetical protein